MRICHRRLLVTLAAGTALAAPATAAGDTLFGISDGSSIFPYEGSADAPTIARLQAGAGAEAGRFTIRWEEVQPAEPPAVGPPRMDWAAPDELADAQRQAGIEPLPLLLGAPGWARERGCSGVCPPSSEQLADWRLFVAAAAARYSDGAALEIWNEPNLAASWSAPEGPDPASYAALFAPAREAARRVAPTLPILVGGLAYVRSAAVAAGSMPIDRWLAGFYAAPVARSAIARDNGVGIGLHVYPAPNEARAVGAGRVGKALAQVRDAIAAGDPRPGGREVWATEFGASTTADPESGAEVTPALQAELIAATRAFLEAQPDVGAALLYTLVDRAPSGDGEEGFGIVGRGPLFAPKPAYCELAAGAGGGRPDGCPAG